MKVLVAGDFCPLNRIAELIDHNDYSFFDDIKKIQSSVDYSIVNFECPVVKNIYKPIEKCGPNLCCQSNAIDAIQYAGFDLVTLANNHIMDYGEEGLRDTLIECEDHHIAVVGVGKNKSEASQVFYTTINGQVLAIVNCCEHEFSVASEANPGANALDPIQQYYAICEAKKNADFVLIIVHGGHEMYQLPSPRMVEMYHFYIDIGATAVINHHQHCYSGYEIYKGCPIFYGLGNLCFDRRERRDSIWNEGYMVVLSLDVNKISYSIIPYMQGNYNANVELYHDEKRQRLFYSNIERLNNIICDKKRLQEKYQKWVESNALNCLYSLEPYSGNKYLFGLYKKHLLPTFLSKRKLIRILNNIQCESHRDRLTYILNNRVL